MSEAATQATETTAWAQLADVADVIQACAWEAPAWVWLERVPACYVERNPRETGFVLKQYPQGLPTDLDLNQWQIGRVFDATQEVQWQWLPRSADSGVFHAVWCGQGQPPAGFTVQAHGGSSQRDQAYFLWGRRVSPADLKALKLSAPPDEAVFMQLQIPRPLRYPLVGNKDFAQLQVREFYAPNGELTYARLCGLGEYP